MRARWIAAVLFLVVGGLGSYLSVQPPGVLGGDLTDLLYEREAGPNFVVQSLAVMRHRLLDREYRVFLDPDGRILHAIEARRYSGLKLHNSSKQTASGERTLSRRVVLTYDQQRAILEQTGDEWTWRFEPVD